MRRLAIIFMSVLLLFTQTALAEDIPVYRLGPGDVLQISVWGYPELVQEVEVRPDGMITFPLVADVLVKNLMPAEVKEILTKELSEYVQAPQVTVVVKKFRTVMVQVNGAVRNPGLYHLRPSSNVSDALAVAGGVTDDGDLSRVKVISQQGGPQYLDIAGYYLEDVPENRRVEDGDEIVVAELRKVTILGEVRKPGQVSVKIDDGVLEIIARAGGPTDRAQLNKVRVYRGADLTDPQAVVVGRSNLLFEGDVQENPKIAAGDIVFIPETKKPNWQKILTFLTVLVVSRDLLNL